jgi:hypothetical protein
MERGTSRNTSRSGHALLYGELTHEIIGAFFEGRVAGVYRPDFFVDGRIVVELKATRSEWVIGGTWVDHDTHSTLLC